MWKTKYSKSKLKEKHFSKPEDMFNPHMHKMGPQGPKHYVFGDHFCSKNARKLRFYVYLHFNARKHMILSFYLMWTEFTRNCEFAPIQFDQQLEQNSQFLVNSLHFRQNDVMFCNMKQEEYMNLSFLLLEQKQFPKIYCLGTWGPNTKLFWQCDVSF